MRAVPRPAAGFHEIVADVSGDAHACSFGACAMIQARSTPERSRPNKSAVSLTLEPDVEVAELSVDQVVAEALQGAAPGSRSLTVVGGAGHWSAGPVPDGFWHLMPRLRATSLATLSRSSTDPAVLARLYEVPRCGVPKFLFGYS